MSILPFHIFQFLLKNGDNEAAIPVLKEVSFDDKQFKNICRSLAKAHSQKEPSDYLQNLKTVQQAQPRFKQFYIQYLDEIVKMQYRRYNPIYQIENCSLTEKIGEIIAHLYVGGFFELHVLKKFINEATFEFRRPNYMISGVFIRTLSICWEKLKHEDIVIYLDALHAVFHFRHCSTDAFKDYFNSIHSEFSYDNKADELLAEFNKLYPSDPDVANPSPPLKYSLFRLMKKLSDTEERFIGSYHDPYFGKFFAFYAPDGRDDSKIMNDTFVLIDQLKRLGSVCEDFLKDINEAFYELVKKLKDFQQKKALNILHYIAEMFLKCYMDLEMFEKILNVVIEKVKKERTALNILYFDEILTSNVEKRLESNRRIMMKIKDARKRIDA